jgi:RNA polymerase sporulation-specific sigma factor
MMGFVQAVECYREDKNVSFQSFLKLCVERECRSLLRKHRGLSYSLISASLSLDMTISEDENLYLIDTIACTNPDFDPQWQFRYNEAKRSLMQKLSEMTPFEAKVVKYRMEGYSYAEIAQLCDVSPKAVDNALQRIKKKLSSV